MKISLYILSLLLLLTVSCRKEDLIIDREDLLSKDTAYIMYQVQYNSHTATAVNLTVDMLKLNGVNSESSYSTQNFVDFGAMEIALNFSSANSFIHGVYPEYSTVFVFDYAETESFEQNFAGFYLRRFFEITDSLPNKNVALSSISAEDNTPSRLHVQNPGDIFGNSWEYNIGKFYEYTAHDDFNSNAASGLFLKGRLTDLMDSLVASPQATGDLSITLLSGYGGYDFTNYTDLDDIIDKAIQNNIKINIISPSGNSDLIRMANETGGFASSWIGDENGNPLPNDNQIPNVQITLQNLDNLLMGKVITHRVDITAITTNTWQSGDHVYLKFIYDKHLFDILMRLP